MPEISARALVCAVQAIDSEILRLRSLSDGTVVPDDDELLLHYENAAEELEVVYTQSARTITNLPEYSKLIKLKE